MVFSSTVFLFVFLPIVLGAYFLLPGMLRNSWLLVMSLLFYAWGAKVFTLAMLGSIGVNYMLGLVVDRFRGRRHALWVVAAGVAINLSLLICYKYAGFLVDLMNPVLALFHFVPIRLKPVHMPIGISFFTFHAISYVVDVYRGHAKVQRNILNFALYESLFPQLVAGPIIRYQDIADQIDARKEKLVDFAYGVRRFILGLSKKVLIANVLAGPAGRIFDMRMEDLTMPVAWLGVTFYALQIYFDFSGYSDMAIGLGRMFGFKFVENFNYPYISQSIQEFWRRWHISLSTWFRDYLYIPMGGNRVPPWRVYFNLVTVFFLCGLWHGASWNFVIWGLLHGLFLAVERQKWMAWMERIWTPLRHLYTMLVVLVGWVFFRSENFSLACSYLKAMAGFGQGDGTLQHASQYFNTLVGGALLAGIVGSLPVAIAIRKLDEGKSPVVENIFALARTAMLGLMFILCAMQLAAGTYNPFIYFRF